MGREPALFARISAEREQTGNELGPCMLWMGWKRASSHSKDDADVETGACEGAGDVVGERVGEVVLHADHY